MNKGVQIANGKWIIFMNAGDCLFDKDVLLSASKHCMDDEYGIVYGNCVHEKYGLYYTYQSEDYAFIKYDLPFCHQSCFTLRDVLLQYKFNEQLPVIGDYELYLRLYVNGIKAKKIDSYYSIFAFGGVSSSNPSKYRIEMLKLSYNQKLISSQEMAERTEALMKSVEVPQPSDSGVRKWIPRFIRKKRGIYIERQRMIKDGWLFELPVNTYKE